MKTQIINRTILLIIAIFSINNNSSNLKSTTYLNSKIIVVDNNKISSACTIVIEETPHSNHSACLGCATVNREDVPNIPEPDGDHEFHSFKVNHNEKRTPLWKSIANKIAGIIYYVVVFMAYLPYRMLS